MLSRFQVPLLAAFLLLLTQSAVAPRPATAQAAGQLQAPVVAFIDMPFIMSRASAAKTVQNQWESFRTRYETDVKQIEDSLREADRSLMRERQVLGPDAFADRRRQYDQQIKDAQRTFSDRGRMLYQVRAQAFSQIEAELFKVIIEIAQARNIDYVLFKAAIAVADNKFNLSQDVLQRLDERLPTVAVQDPATARPTAGQ